MSSIEFQTDAVGGQRTGWRLGKFATPLLLLCMLAPLWLSLADHPIAPRSESRYAVVSKQMAASGDWLVPHLDDKPHLTKPPLTYWLQALGLRVYGFGEFAIRALLRWRARSRCCWCIWWGGRSVVRGWGCWRRGCWH